MITAAIWFAWASLQAFAVGLAPDPDKWSEEERRLILLGHILSFLAAIIATAGVNA